MNFPPIFELPLHSEWEQQTTAPPGGMSEPRITLGIKAPSSCCDASSIVLVELSLGILPTTDTHDYRLGSLNNGQTEGYQDGIMAKHRKDRDSWGECTYNI